MLTIEALKNNVSYNPASGMFTWLVRQGRAKAGDEAGWIGGPGYRYIRVHGVTTTAARLAWFYFHGKWPDREIEHINCDPLDCRIGNLQLCQKEKGICQLTTTILRSLIEYDPITGIFVRKPRPGTSRRRKITGTYRDNGYVLISVNQRLYRAHRLAWLYTFGHWPKKHIDHINGDPSDNRLANLREASVAENMANAKKPSTNKSGYKGVSWHAGAKKWQAQIRIKNSSRYLGLFDDPSKAHEAYCRVAIAAKGAFARTS